MVQVIFVLSLVYRKNKLSDVDRQCSIHYFALVPGRDTLLCMVKFLGFIGTAGTLWCFTGLSHLPHKISGDSKPDYLQGAVGGRQKTRRPNYPDLPTSVNPFSRRLATRNAPAQSDLLESDSMVATPSGHQENCTEGLKIWKSAFELEKQGEFAQPELLYRQPVQALESALSPDVNWTICILRANLTKQSRIVDESLSFVKTSMNPRNPVRSTPCTLSVQY